MLRTFYVEVSDTCVTGASTLTLSREMEFMSLARIVDADLDGQARELAFEARAGATARGVQAKIVRFKTDASGCVQTQKPSSPTPGRRRSESARRATPSPPEPSTSPTTSTYRPFRTKLQIFRRR